jgi:hypothetical protein
MSLDRDGSRACTRKTGERPESNTCEYLRSRIDVRQIASPLRIVLAHQQSLTPSHMPTELRPEGYAGCLSGVEPVAW